MVTVKGRSVFFFIWITLFRRKAHLDFYTLEIIPEFESFVLFNIEQHLLISLPLSGRLKIMLPHRIATETKGTLAEYLVVYKMVFQLKLPSLPRRLEATWT